MLILKKIRTNPWTGLSVGIAASALLFAACADESPVRTTKRSTPAPVARAAQTPSTTGIGIPQRASHSASHQATVPAELPPSTLAAISESSFIGPPAPPTAAEVAASWGEGVALYDSGDYTGAIVPLQIAADGLPDEPYTQYLFGLALWKVGEFDSAERALRVASDLNPDSIKTWINLARVRLDKDDAQGALAAADSALAIDAGSADAVHQRGRALAALKRNDDALEALERAYELDPENGYVANTLGYLLLQSDRAGDALPYLEAARERLPEVAYVRNNLGVAYERSGDIASAVGEYRAAVEAGDSGGKALASIGRLEPILERFAANLASDEEAAEVIERGDDEETADAGTTQASMEIDPAGN